MSQVARGEVAVLDSMVSERCLLKHPFYQAWTVGELSIGRLRTYAVQYYPHVAAFPRYLSAIHSRCDDFETRRELLENLIDEERGADNHPELWLRFAEALGVPRAEVLAATPLPAATALVDTFARLTREGPLAAGLAALYVYESQVAQIAAAKIDGLRRFYDVDDSRGLAFFEVHQEADAYHARSVARLIERHTSRGEDSRAAVEAADQALDALWTMLSAV